jgi:ribosome recycling factor
MNEQINDILEEAKMGMEEAIEALQRQFRTLRTGKVNINILDNIFIDYYGSKTKLAQVATVLTTDATTITISPWEKNLLGAIEKAIQIANIGVNPTNDGTQIKLFFPPMTTEQRHESVKLGKTMVDNAKVSIRNNRRDANNEVKKLEKDKEITPDESKTAQDNVQKLTDTFVQKTDDLLKAKESEILKV